jgi:[ribosomal protein S5]-alanine N-acetyltransferase
VREVKSTFHILPAIETDRLLLTIPGVEAAPQLLAYAVENEEHLAPFEPSRPKDFFSLPFWHRRIEVHRDEFFRDRSMRLVLLRRDDPGGPILGHCNYSNFIRGAFQACYLGYSLDHRHRGRGVMREAITGSLRYVFDALKLHRVMANYLPTNERSGRLLEGLGFVVEGYARDYVFINGAYRDHVLTSLTNPNPSPPPLGG